MKNETRKKDELIADLIRITEEVENDPEVAEKAEAFKKKYCTSSWEDLHITFTI